MRLPSLAACASRMFVVVPFSAAFSLPLAAQRIDYSQLEIKATDLGNGVHLLNWQGGDSLILVGDEGVLLVDTSVAAMGEKIRAAIAKVTDKPIKFIVNTHAHADHFGANEALANDGAVIVAHAALRDRMAKGFTAFGQAIPPASPAALPTIVYTDSMTLHFNGETIRLYHPPNAHTDSDTLVHFVRANVIHASGTIGGDGGYPFFDAGLGGSLSGTILAQDKMLSVSDENTKIVADEGAPASTAMLKASRDMLVALRDRVQKLIDEGKSEDEAVAAKPTKDFDDEFVHQGNFLTGDAMTRLAYQSLRAPSAR